MKIPVDTCNTVIFDLGNVLVHYDAHHCLDQYDFDKKTKIRINQAVFQSSAWVEGDRGTYGLHFIESFHGGVFSWKEKCLKPDARIYRILLKRYDLNPASCLFFDDREDNVVAACREGIHGVVFGPSVVEEILHNR